jgi:hypothetical protein
MKYVRLGSSGLKVSHVCLGVKRNVVELAEVPTGRDGRTSKSLTPEQVDAVLTATAPHRMHNYIVLSLLTGARTEELRALHWTMCTSATRLMGNHRCPRTSRCGDQCGRAGIRRPADRGARSHCQLDVSMHCGISATGSTRSGPR